jgi:hypothetical protein
VKMKAVITFDTEGLSDGEGGEALVPSRSDMKSWFEERVADDAWEDIQTDEGTISFGFLNPKVEVTFDDE